MASLTTTGVGGEEGFTLTVYGNKDRTRPNFFPSFPRIILVLSVGVSLFLSVCSDVNVPIVSHWDGGFQGEACFDITTELSGWKVTLSFDTVIDSLEVWVADVSQTLDGGKIYILTNKDWNRDEHIGDELCMTFIGHADGDIQPTVIASMDGLAGGGHHGESTLPPVTAYFTAPPGQTLPTITPIPLVLPLGEGEHSDMTIIDDLGLRFTGLFSFQVTENIIGWMINVSFTKPVTSMDSAIGDAFVHSSDGYIWSIVNKADTPVFNKGESLDLSFTGNYMGGYPAPDASAVLINLGRDNFTPTPTPKSDNSKYNYDEILYKSILFYEAQRSGKLPTTNRIPWRGDSALGDRGDNGEDLSGGWYTAGDHVKFNFPVAYSTTILAWSVIEYPDAYAAANQTENVLDSIKWPLDYLLKCHTARNELYVQVGDAGADHSYWGPPEKMTMGRPAYKITPSQPGSDVAMETAAAMAAGYLVFKNRNQSYANILLDHAKQLWDFAIDYQGFYTDSVQAAAGYYRSSNYTDELCWGSLWLYKATGSNTYLNEAQKHFDPEPAWGPSWDEKTIGNQLLLYNLTKSDVYRQAVERTFRVWLPGGTIPYTPQGLAFRMKYASLKYALGMAMGALLAADYGISPNEYRQWAMCQVHYALGDTGFSYVIGFGDQYPLRPHHRSSSCPNLPAPCGIAIMSGSQPNVHTLYGALVGGPGQSDDYSDERSNYIANEVACDYNAGLQGSVAALKHLILIDEHPEQKGTAKCPFTNDANSNSGHNSNHV